jgi:hypothetical protein
MIVGALVQNWITDKALEDVAKSMNKNITGVNCTAVITGDRRGITLESKDLTPQQAFQYAFDISQSLLLISLNVADANI